MSSGGKDTSFSWTPFSLVTSDHPQVSVVGSSSVNASEGDEVTLTCLARSNPLPVVTWFFNGTEVITTSSDVYRTTQTIDSEYSLIINNATTVSTGTYTCVVNNTAIPEVVMEQIFLTVRRELYCYATTQVPFSLPHTDAK